MVCSSGESSETPTYWIVSCLGCFGVADAIGFAQQRVLIKISGR